MKKGNGLPSSGERTGEPSFISQIREQLEALRKMYEAVDTEPDYSGVWTDPDFAKLPQDVQDSLRQEYGAPVEARPSPENAATIDALREELNARKRMYEAVQTPPDYSDTWNGSEFLALPPDVQKKVRAEFPDVPTPPAKEPRRPSAQAMPPRQAERTELAEPQEQQTERAERPERPKKREFESYGIAADKETGKLIVVENFKERDKKPDGPYRDKRVRTGISIPGSLASAVAQDQRIAAELVDFCASLREKLDEKGVKIYLDRPENEPEKVRPKWKYYVDKKMVEEALRLEDFPPEIAELVKTDEHYFRDPSWKKWFGRMMQAKREAIISAGLAEWAKNKAPAAKNAEEKEDQPVTDEMMLENAPITDETDAKGLIEEERRAEKEKELSFSSARKIAMDLIVSLTELYPLPDKTEKFLEHLDRFAESFLEMHYKQRPKMPASARLTTGELKDAVREALRDFFSDSPEVLSAVPEEPVIVEETPRSAPESARAVNVQAEMETKVSPAYQALRLEAGRIRSEVDLDNFVTELSVKAKDADPEVRQAATTLLVEIDHGQIGPVSETRRTGFERSEAEREFFKTHPLLDRRNIEMTNDGRAVIYLDRLHANEALTRTVRLLVLDALSEDKAESKLVEQIGTYMYKILGRRKADLELSKRFKDSVAELNFSNGELVIKDTKKLFDIIHKAADYFSQNPPIGGG